MNRHILIFLFFSYLNTFSQNSSKVEIDLFNLKNTSTFLNSDTILGVPFFSNHNIHFLTKNSFNEFSYFDNNNLVVDFSEYIEKGNNLSFKFFSENDLLFFGFPKAETYYSFGFKYSSYLDLNISNELLDLFWNGNNQYLDDFTYFEDNTASLIQFSSIFFQFSSKISDNFLFGTRVSLLHGVNFFNLEKGNFSLQALSDSITPFSNSINTDIFFESSRANFFGFSNPGLSLNLGAEYNLKNWHFVIDFQNLGFIFWHKRNSQNQSEGYHFFDGVDYTMDEILSEEVAATIDTLENIFTLDRISTKSFYSRLPLRINLRSAYSYNLSTDFFIDYYAIENNISNFSHHVFLGCSKVLKKDMGFSMAYNFNNYSFNNIQFGFIKKFKNLLIKFNTNNLLAILDFRGVNTFHFQTGIYYYF